MDKIYTIIPAHNEEGRVGKVVEEVLKYCKNVVVINDGSLDSTEYEAKQFPVTVLNIYPNKGKGNALKEGCEYAIRDGAEILIVIDADGQHEPKEIPNLITEIENNDIVFTYRNFVGSMPFVFRFGNWFISNVINILFNIKLWDTQCGYRIFRKEVFNKIKWNETGYFMDT